MSKSIKIIKQNQEHVTDIFKEGIKTDIVFREIQKDPIGKSGANPTWGYVYYKENNKLKFKGVALHKEYDYDFPKSAYGEKVWSIFGKEILEKSVRVPKIELVKQESGHDEIISYRLMNNDIEDMVHIKDILFNKFQREEIKAKKDIYTIDEILDCVKFQIQDEDNYKQVEKDMIQVLLLDAVTNNGDRHALNWALVRDEKTNKYSLAVFDHSSSFVDMFEDKSYILKSGWVSSYTTVGNERGRTNIGSDGKKIVEYISKQYPEYFKEFCEKFNNKLPKILEQVKQENLKIDFSRLNSKMKIRNKYLNKLINKGEYEYEQ